MFRHGVRSWVSSYPGEPLNISVWDSQGGLSVLTNNGVEQMANYGKFFREYFGEKISFKPEKTFVRTTDYNRTITSAKYFLEGLFGNNNISINNVPRITDYVSIDTLLF